MLLGLIMVSIAIVVLWSAQKISDKVKVLTRRERTECLTSSGCLCGACGKDRIEPKIN